MKKIVFVLFCMLACLANVNAQQVTKTAHKKGVKTDVVTTGSMTIRKPNYICISTDNDRDQLIMDGTKFTMTMGGKKHVTDSRKNPQFVTFQAVLEAVINGRQVPAGEDLTSLLQEKSVARCSRLSCSLSMQRLLHSACCA